MILIQARIQVATRTFNRIFNAGTNIIIPASYAEELINQNAPVLIHD